jgi:uncharacterized membrane protein
MAKDPVFLYLATFTSRADADAAFKHVRELHSAGAVGTYDAAVVAKDDEGKIHVRKDEKPTQYGAWTGLAVGAVVGLVFPPLLLTDLAFAAFGAGAGALVAHFRNGMSRSDAKAIGELIDDSEAALIVVGKSSLTEAIDTNQIRAKKQWEKQVPIEQAEFDAALAEAAQAVAD